MDDHSIEDIERRMRDGELRRLEATARAAVAAGAARLAPEDSICDSRLGELWDGVLGQIAAVRRELRRGNAAGAANEQAFLDRLLRLIAEEPLRAGRLKGVTTQQARRGAKVARWQPRYTQLRAAGVATVAAYEQIVVESSGTSTPVSLSWCGDNLFDN
ncbi:MAG: hypothetical protein U1E42_09765 [Rhodospirillales bacterium]